MTISSTTLRKTFTGDGATAAFTFNYRFLANADLKVYLNGTLKTLTTHYTVTGAGDAGGGTVTFGTAPALNDEVVILNDPSNTQSLDLVDNDSFPAESLEQALDRLTLQVQRCRDLLNRSMVLADADVSGASVTLPAPTADNLLAWNTAADGLINVDPGNLGSLTIGAGGISTAHLADLAVTAGKLANGALSADAAGRAKMADRFTTFAKVQAIATGRLLGRTSASSGDIEELTADASMSLAAGALGQAAGSIVGGAVTVSNSSVSTAATIPNDPTIPTNTEGAEHTGIATTYTPKFANSKLLVTVTIGLISSSASDPVGCIFRDSDAGASSVSRVDAATNNVASGMTVRALFDANSTSATTFKFRYGGASGTTYIGTDGASAVYGTAGMAMMTVQEIKQ